MGTSQNIIRRLERRRKDLGISCAALASRTGLSLRTIQRVLAAREASADFSTILRIADVLGMSLKLVGTDLNEIRRVQAYRKAEKLVGMVQGTMALEDQAVDDASLREMKERTVRELLAGSSRRLWDE